MIKENEVIHRYSPPVEGEPMDESDLQKNESTKGRYSEQLSYFTSELKIFRNIAKKILNYIEDSYFRSPNDSLEESIRQLSTQQLAESIVGKLLLEKKVKEPYILNALQKAFHKLESFQASFISTCDVPSPFAKK